MSSSISIASNSQSQEILEPPRGSERDILEFIQSNQLALDRRLRHMERDYRLTVAKAVMTVWAIRQSMDPERVLHAIKLRFAVRASNKNDVSIVLQGLISYGDEGRQFLSRDKAAVNWVDFDCREGESPETCIQRNGGLAACAKNYRDHQGADKTSTAATDPASLLPCPPISVQSREPALTLLSDLKPAEGKLVHALIDRAGNIVRWQRLPEPANEAELDAVWSRVSLAARCEDADA